MGVVRSLIVVMGLLAVVVAGAAPAAGAKGGVATGHVTVSAGAFARGGTAQVLGTLPRGQVFAPRAYALTRGKRYSRSAIRLGAGLLKAPRGRFNAWVSLPDLAPTGRFRLLACRGRSPTVKGCVALGTVAVASAPTIPTATATLDTARSASETLAIGGGTVTAIGADGTTYTLTVPPTGRTRCRSR